MPAPRRAAAIPLPALLAAIVVATIAAFSPLLQNGFVNWDDPDAILHNRHLTEPGLLSWAMTTTHMSHFQPLSWITWSALMRRATAPAGFHALSLFIHLLNIVLVALLAATIVPRAGAPGRGGASVTAALIFGIHPLRVEPVAWASAFPYVLSTTFLILATLTYLRWQARGGVWLVASVSLYGLSTLARPIAPALPIVLAVLDRCQMRPVRLRFLSKLPFLALTAIGLLLEFRARPIVGLSDVGLGARLTATVAAPFFYLWQTIAPFNLAPLRPLPLASASDPLILAGGGAALILITIVCLRTRERYPALLAGWLSYLVLLAPAIGLTPSGLQATADRYTYVPGIAIALSAGVLSTAVWQRRTSARLAAPLLVLMTLGFGYGVWRQCHWWRDSIALWSRAVDLNPANDIALYNLGVALAAEGRDDDAITSYEQTLKLVPDHGAARHNLLLLEATRFQRQADTFAAAGRLGEAIDAYDQALARDPARLLALAARGITKLRLERVADATVDLRRAWASGIRDAPTANALAFALVSSGAEREAGSVLRQALAASPTNGEVAANLARLLATADDPAVRDPALALTLATRASAEAGDRDPRLLDTLAAAYAGSGDLARGLEASRRAASIARSSGDSEMADQIEFNWERYVESSRSRRPLLAPGDRRPAVRKATR